MVAANDGTSLPNPVDALRAIQADPRYQDNLDWGRPRSGHPEGTIRAHIAELEHNLRRLSSRLGMPEIDRIRLLIHTHDTFKPDARSGVPISDPRSHAALARSFLEEFFPDPDLLAMVAFHDEPYALWNRTRGGRPHDATRLDKLLSAITDHDLFNAFLLVDGCTGGNREIPSAGGSRKLPHGRARSSAPTTSSGCKPARDHS